MFAAAPCAPMLLLGVAFSACAASWPREPQIELLSAPIDLYVDASRTDYRWAGRVVDALTGEPIPGAVVYQIPEHNRPEGGRFWCDGSWRADRDGFVRVPQREATSAAWFVVQAPGYGPLSEMHCPPDQVIHLLPGIDLPVVVQDWSGRPVAGAEVGFCLGCGHTPDVRVATTDGEGLAWVRGVETTGNYLESGGGAGIRDLYVRHPDLSGYYDESRWRLGDPPVLRRQRHVADVVGHITSPDGKPLAGVAVGGGLHRGPWTWTDGGGRFHHSGRESADDDLMVALGDTVWYLTVPSRPQPVELVLPPPELPLERPTGLLLVTVRDASNKEPLFGAIVRARLPGISSSCADESDDDETNEDGIGRLRLVTGTFEVAIESPAPTFESTARRINVAADQEAHLTVDLERRPLVTATLDGWHAPHVDLVTRAREERLPLPAAGPPSLPLPAHEPFVLCVDDGDGGNERRFRFDAVPDAPLALRPFPPTHVRARVVDQRGAPLPARVALAKDADASSVDEVEAGDWLAAGADGCFDLRTTRVGCAFLLVQPIGPGHRPRVVHLSLPPRGEDRAVETGDVVLQDTAAPRLAVRRADGTPAAGRVRLLRPGLVASGELAADGGFDGLEPMAGDRITVWIEEEEQAGDGEERLPLTEQLRGKGPWTLRQADGTLAIEVCDEHGQAPRNVCVVLRDREINGGNSHRARFLLHDVPPGPIELFVGAEELQSARVRLTLDPGARRELTVTLPHR